MAWNYYIMDWVVVLRCEAFCLRGVGHLSWGCETFVLGVKDKSSRSKAFA